MVVGHGEVHDRRLGGLTGLGEGLRSHPAGGEGRVTLAAQLEGRGKLSLRLRVADPVAGAVSAGRDLPPSFCRLTELTRELGTAPVALEGLDSELLRFAVLPEL